MLLGMDAKASPFCVLPEGMDEMKKRIWEKTPMELFRELSCRAEGLTAAEAGARLETYGPNELQAGGKKSVARVFLEQFRDFLVVILILAAAVSAALGDGESAVVIFYAGSAPMETVAEYLCPLLSRLERQWAFLPPQTPFTPCPGQDVAETMEVAQGKLCMGFTTPTTNRDPEFAAMQVFNTLYGAGMTSKLFLNVREKLSLCYSVGSAYYGSKGIVTVAAGIDFDKEQQTRQEILRQLEDCKQGRITDEELLCAKEAIFSSLRTAKDSPGSLEGYYATAAISGVGLTLETYMEAVKRVTLDQAVAAANTVTLHSTYFLRGGSQ